MGEKMDKKIDLTFIGAIPDLDFEDTLFGDIRLTIKTVLSAVHQCMGVSIVKLLLFSQLFAAQELSQAELQKRLGVDGAVITRLVKQLETQELITRRPDPTDNRFTLVALTERAYKLTKENLDRRRKMATVLMHGISTEDKECIQRVLAQIQQNAQDLSAGGEVVKK